MKKAICTILIAVTLTANLAGCANMPTHYRETFPNYWLDRPAYEDAAITLRTAIRDAVLLEHPHLADDEEALEAEVDRVYEKHARDIKLAQKEARRMQTRLEAARALGALLAGLVRGGIVAGG